MVEKFKDEIIKICPNVKIDDLNWFKFKMFMISHFFASDSGNVPSC